MAGVGVKPDSAQGRVGWWEVRLPGDSGQWYCNPTRVGSSRWPHWVARWPRVSGPCSLLHSFTHSCFFFFLNIKLFIIYISKSVGGPGSCFLQSCPASCRNKASTERTFSWCEPHRCRIPVETLECVLGIQRPFWAEESSTVRPHVINLP